MGFKVAEYSGSSEGSRLQGGVFEAERISSFTRSRDADPFLRVDSATVGQIGLHRVRSSGHTVTVDEYSRMTFLLPQSGSIVSESTTARTEAPTNSILVCPLGSRQTTVRVGPTGHFDAKVVLISAAQMPRSKMQGFTVANSAMSGRSGLRQAVDLAETVGFAFGAVERLEPQKWASKRSNLIAALVLDCADAFLGSFSPDDEEANPAGASQQAIVRRAEQIIAEEYFESLSIAGIANRLRVSTRTLQTAFQSVHGSSPREYLNGYRMERAHEMLTSTDRSYSVSSVALASGFSHFGRFSAAYRAKFGELPSETGRC